MARTNRGTLITGKSGFGKSWFEGYLIEGVEKPLIIIDPKNEHRGLARHFLVIDRAAYDKAKAIGLRTFWTRCLTKWPSLRVQILGLDMEEGQELIGELAWVMHARGNIVFVAGEYHRYAPNKGQGLGETPKGLIVLHTDARTVGVDWIVSTQRPALLNTTIVTQANVRVTFMMDDPNDVARVAGFFDSIEGTPARAAIPRLPPRTCIIRDCDNGNQELVSTESLTRRTKHYG